MLFRSADALRRLTYPLQGDPAIVARGSGGAGLAGLMTLTGNPDARGALGPGAVATCENVACCYESFRACIKREPVRHFGRCAVTRLFGRSLRTMASAVVLAGFCTLGAQFGNNAASGLIYPTAIRSRGVGWALGVGRFGSVIGPLVGGMLIGMKLPLQQLFLLAAVPMVVGLIASVSVAGLFQNRFGGMHLDDMAEPVLAKTPER